MAVKRSVSEIEDAVRTNGAVVREGGVRKGGGIMASRRWEERDFRWRALWMLRKGGSICCLWAHSELGMG